MQAARDSVRCMSIYCAELFPKLIKNFKIILKWTANST